MMLKGLNEGKNTSSHSEGEAVVFVSFLCFLRFFIRFCASHRKFLLLPHGVVHGLQLLFITKGATAL